MFKGFYKITLAVVAASVLVATLWVTAGLVKAAGDGTYGLKTAATQSGLSSNQISSSATGGSIPKVLGNLISIVLAFVGVYFFILILYAGFTWMTASGSQEKVASAKARITSAAIGLAIVLSAYTITNFVFTTFVQESGVKCATTPDGVFAEEDCGRDEVCQNHATKCVSECDYNFKNYSGACFDTTAKACDGIIVTGMCGSKGESFECCVPNDGYSAWVSEGEAAPQAQGTTGGTEESECEKQGYFCTDKTSCETVQNGKALESMGCATGEICCKNCSKIGGKCIDTTIYTCNGVKNQKSGYCYGVYEAPEFKCCIGEYTSNISDIYFK